MPISHFQMIAYHEGKLIISIGSNDEIAPCIPLDFEAFVELLRAIDPDPIGLQIERATEGMRYDKVTLYPELLNLVKGLEATEIERLAANVPATLPALRVRGMTATTVARDTLEKLRDLARKATLPMSFITCTGTATLSPPRPFIAR